MSAPASAPATATLCQVCSTNPAKYTCPRCTTRTCSLACSRTHKSTSACSGERDKAAYVPLKDYGYGKLMDDYVFLEDGKRRVEQWGKQIVGLKMGDGSASTSAKPLPAKSVALQRALRERGIRVDFLPDGMERRRKNQSHYNTKTHLVHLSMEFKYPSPPPGTTPPPHAVPSSQMQGIPLTEATTLLGIYTSHARKIPVHYPQAQKEEKADLVFVMKAYQPSGTPLPSPPSPTPTPTPTPTTSQKTSKPMYLPLLGSDPLPSVLAGTAFVEFPTVEVYLRDDWDRLCKEGEVGVVPVPTPTPTSVSRKRLETEERAPGDAAEDPSDGHSIPPHVGDPAAAVQPSQSTEGSIRQEGNPPSGLALDYGSDSGSESEEEGQKE